MGIDLSKALQDATSLFSSPQQQQVDPAEYDYEELPQDVEYFEEYDYEEEPESPAPTPVATPTKKNKKAGSSTRRPSTSRRPGGRSAIPNVRWEAWALMWLGCYVVMTIPLLEFIHPLVRGITSMPVVGIAAGGYYIFNRLWDRPLNERAMNEFLLSYIVYAALAFVMRKS